MFKTYLKIAWRNLWKSKVLTGVNLLGMTVAFATALLLGMTIYFENSFDNFHQNGASIFQVYRSMNEKNKVEEQSNLPMALSKVMKDEGQNIKASSRFMLTSALMRYGDKTIGENIELVDEDFLHMFTFPVVAGDQQRPLKDMGNMVLPAKVATALFGNVSPIGKTVEVNFGDAWKSFVVTASTKDVPANSSIDNAAIMRFENGRYYESSKDQWGNMVTQQFVQLKDPSRAAGFGPGMQPLIRKYFSRNIEERQRDGIKPDAQGNMIRLGLIPLSEVHFSELSGVGAGIGHRFVYLLMLIAGFILFIAATNFINITLARAFGRGREIGMRKVMGAFQGQLVLQLWSEALIQCLVALLAGTAIAALLLPVYNAMFRNELTFSLLKSPVLLCSIAAIFALITVLAGGYPAWRMARFNTLTVLKGKVVASKGNRLRNALIMGQFTIAAVLICCTIVAWQQVNYLRNKPLGYNKSQVISIPIETGMNPTQTIKLLRNKLAAETQVKSISGSDINIGRGQDGGSGRSIMGFTYEGHTVSTNWRNIAYDYVSTMDLKLVAGRDFSNAFATDSNALVINEAMARQLGGTKEALGKRMPIQDGLPPMEIIGVVKDFNFESLKNEIMPLTMSVQNPADVNYIFVRVAPGNLPASMNLVKNAWQTVAPGKEFTASFLDENTDRQYKQEGRLTSIFISSAILAIVIACMGLFAIAVMAMSLRTREIGIRKVLGASVSSIVALLSADFLKLVGMAIIIAIPVSWVAMQHWLADYAYRVNIQVWVFILAAAISVGIAFLTISFNAIRTALSNPVKSLRSE